MIGKIAYALFYQQNFLKMFIKNIFLSLDIFPQEPQLYVNKQQFHKTFFGLISSIFLYVILGLCIYTFGKQMVERQFPITSTQSIQVQIPPFMTIEPKTLPIAFGVFDYQTEEAIKPDGIYQISIFYVKSYYRWDQELKQNKIVLESEELEPEICDHGVHFDMPELSTYWNINNINEYYCFPQNSKIKFGGNYYIGQSYYIEAYIKVCQNDPLSETGNQCQPIEQINERLNSIYITTVSPQINIDPSSNTIFSYFAQSFWTMASTQFMKTIIMSFKQVDVMVDQGFLLEDVSNEKKFSYSTTREMADNLGEGNIFQLWIEVDSTLQTVSIKYKKVQEVIAEIGGLMNIAIVILSVLASRFTQIHYYNSIIEENMNSFEGQTNAQLGIFDDNKQQEIKQKHIIYKNSAPLNLLDQFLIGIGIGKKQKYKIFKAGKQIIEQSLSISNILQLKAQFEVLKYLVLQPLKNKQLQKLSKQNLIYLEGQDHNQGDEQDLQNIYFQQMLSKLNKVIKEDKILLDRFQEPMNQDDVFDPESGYNQLASLDTYDKRLKVFLKDFPNPSTTYKFNSEILHSTRHLMKVVPIENE